MTSSSSSSSEAASSAIQRNRLKKEDDECANERRESLKCIEKHYESTRKNELCNDFYEAYRVRFNINLFFFINALIFNNIFIRRVENKQWSKEI